MRLFSSNQLGYRLKKQLRINKKKNENKYQQSKQKKKITFQVERGGGEGAGI